MRALTPTIAIVLLLLLSVSVATVTINYINSQLHTQTRNIQKENPFKGVKSIGMIVIKTTSLRPYNKYFVFKANLSALENLLNKYGYKFKLCSDEYCTTDFYYYCWVQQNGECSDKFDGIYEIYFRAPLDVNPKIIYVVYGKGSSLADGNAVFDFYEDFDKGIDSNKWMQLNSNCYVNTDNGWLNISMANIGQNCGGGIGIVSKRSLEKEGIYVFEAKAIFKNTLADTYIAYRERFKLTTPLFLNGKPLDLLSASEGSTNRVISINLAIAPWTVYWSTPLKADTIYIVKYIYDFNNFIFRELSLEENGTWKIVYQGSAIHLSSSDSPRVVLAGGDPYLTSDADYRVDWVRVYRILPEKYQIRVYSQT